jgi:hypothetical protein
LGSFSGYDQIYFAAHGWIDSMPQQYHGTYRIGGTEGYGNRYTAKQIQSAASNIVVIKGCEGERSSVLDISAAFFPGTKSFLE